MIFRIEASGKVAVTVPNGYVSFDHPSDEYALMQNALTDAAALLSAREWSFLHLEGEGAMTLAHAGMPVSDVSKDEDVQALFVTISSVAGSVAPRILDKPEITAAQIAVQNAQPKKLNGKWVLGWTVRDKTEAELLAEIPWPDLSSAQVALSAWIDNLTYQIEGKYPRIIRAAWDEEEAMALAYKLGTETEEQLAELTALAATKNRTVDEHADRVLWLAGTFRTIKGHVHELWLATDAALEAAVDPETGDPNPLEYKGIFDTAKAQAAPLAAAYGLQA